MPSQRGPRARHSLKSSTLAGRLTNERKVSSKSYPARWATGGYHTGLVQSIVKLPRDEREWSVLYGFSGCLDNPA